MRADISSVRSCPPTRRCCLITSRASPRRRTSGRRRLWPNAGSTKPAFPLCESHAGKSPSPLPLPASAGRGVHEPCQHTRLDACAVFHSLSPFLQRGGGGVRGSARVHLGLFDEVHGIGRLGCRGRRPPLLSSPTKSGRCQNKRVTAAQCRPLE